jgi:phosphohistidine phosphatase
MRTLLLLRHAKAVPADGAADDHERALAERGHAQAERMAAHLEAEGFAPGLVLCSTARRTVETLAHVRHLLPKASQVELERSLYLASPGTLLSRLQDVPDAQREVLLVGHNPGLEDLARGLAGGGKRKALERLQSFSTGTLAVLRFDGGWRDLAPGGARLEALVRPKDLD